MQHAARRQLRVLTLRVGRSRLLTYVCSQGILGDVTSVLMTPVLLHPHERRAAMLCLPALVPLLIWPLLPRLSI